MKRLPIALAALTVLGVTACSSAPKLIQGTDYTCPKMAQSITSDKASITQLEGPGKERATQRSVLLSMSKQVLADQEKLYGKYCQ